MATIKKRTWTNPKGEQRTAWQLRYVDRDGVERSKQFAKKGDASAYLTKVSWEISQGTHVADSASITVAQAADLWLARVKADDRERSTIKQYTEWCDLHIKPLIGDTRLSQLTVPAVETFKDSLLQSRSAAMANKVIRGLSMILNEAMRRGLATQNNASSVKVARSSRVKQKADIPRVEHVRLLLKTAESLDNDQPALRPMLMTVAMAGLRSSELRGLRRQDVDLKSGHIHVAQRADQWGVIGPPKSAAGTRSIPIPPALVSELRKWMVRAPHSELGLLFPDSKGGVRRHSNLLNREYWPLQIKAGLTRPGKAKDKDGKLIPRARYDFHALRHFAASAWIKQNADLKRLTTWLGHASAQMTLDVYGHLLKDENADARLVAKASAELLR